LLVSFHRSLAGGSEPQWPDAVKIASQAGYDAIDIEIRQIPQPDWSGARHVLDSHRISAGVAPLPVEFRRDEASYVDDLEQFSARCSFARSLGVEVMTRALPPSSDVPPAEMIGTLRRRLLPVLSILERNDMRLALEFIGPLHMRRAAKYELLWNMADALEFIQSVGPTAGLLLDSWHWHHVGATRQDIIEAGDLILNVQVADSARLAPEDVRDDARLLPGRGVVDFPGFLAGLRTIGYSGPVTPEVFGYKAAVDDPVLAAKIALEATRDIF
jgi:sugar phosphate isomerase/epimerase